MASRSAGSARSPPPRTAPSLKLEIDPDQIRYIPANVEAEIDVTTAFGAKFVDLVYPENPSKERLAAGAVLHSKNVSTEVNTVFENVVDLVKMIDPAKLNAVLTAVADAVRGQGERIGQATTDLNQVLTALNDRSETHPPGLALVQELQRHLRRGRPGHPDGLGRRQHHQHHGRESFDVPGQLAAQRHWLRERRDQPARDQQGQSRRIGQRSRAHHEPAAQVQPHLHLLAAGRHEQPEERGLFGVRRRRRPDASI